MDDVLCDYRTAYNAAREKYPDIKYPQSQLDFFRKLLPVEGAIDALNYLNCQDNLEVYILTAPSIRNPLCYLEKRL